MDSGKINIGNGKFVFDGNNLVLTGNVTATAGYIGGTGGWKITSNQITGNANSKIISGILQSTNFVDKSSGVQINLNNGIIKGNIEASTLAAKENFQLYSGSVKHTVLKSTYNGSDSSFTTCIGCALESDNGIVANPGITFINANSVHDMYIQADKIELLGRTYIQKLYTSNFTFQASDGNITMTSLINKINASSNCLQGNRIRFEWYMESGGVWKIRVFVDNQLVRSGW